MSPPEQQTTTTRRTPRLREEHVLIVVLLSACASTGIKPNIDPGHREPGIESPRDALPAPEPRFSQTPALAFHLQKMPLYSTGVPEFLRDHPTYDGRGVLLAILDSGIDAGIAGLDSTATGERKIVDLRDFSGEGRITLTRVTPKRDSVTLGGITVGGFGRVVLFNDRGPWYGGVLRELPLGKAPAADVDGNGVVGDSLLLIVTRAPDGWIVMADSDRDGSLAGERPLRDYLVGRETFGWSSKGRTPRLTVAVNLSEEAGEPVLDLYFDTSGHGSHVAGVAAGHRIYGVPGFNGVAPGAQLLGLKIANNAQGGLSATGSMVRAIDYAIRFAERRRQPLVINLSFGVGNEIEGEARIDQFIDSVLAEHPALVFSVSAGNDGPGLSTLGFPGSAARVLTVGAILPGDPGDPLGAREEPVAYYSARGGELAKPDVVTPGSAYSTVPLWNRGQEMSSGTSVAAPHAAGLAALLVSAMVQEVSAGAPGKTARQIKQALMVTARPVASMSFVDQGAGVPDIGAAYRWLRKNPEVAEIEVRVGPGEGTGLTAAYRPAGFRSAGDTVQTFELLRRAGLPAATYTLRSSVAWLTSPSSVTLTGTRATLEVGYRRELIPPAQTVSGVITGWPADTMAGPMFRLVNTIGAAVPAAEGLKELTSTTIAAGAARRLFIQADSGRPFEATARVGGSQPILVFLHEPGGMPLRGADPQIAGVGQEEVSFKLDGREVLDGAYEIVAVAPPTHASSARFDVRSARLAFDARREASGVVTRIKNQGNSGDPRVTVGLIGGERVVRIIARGSDSVATRFVIPAWATHLVAALTMEREQWSRFTDFGMTLFDSAGAIVETAPLNYAFGRLEVSYDQEHGDSPVWLQLFPGLARPGSQEPWTATLSIRLYAGEEVQLAPLPGGPSAPDQEESTLFAMVPTPWALGDGFFPLGLMEVQQNGEMWTREVPLFQPSGTPMR